MALHTCLPLMPEYLLNLVLQILCQFWKPTNILPIPILHALQLVSSICIQDSSPSQCTKNKRAIQHQWVNQNSQLQIRSSILYFMMLGLRLCKLPLSLSLSAGFLLTTQNQTYEHMKKCYTAEMALQIHGKGQALQ